MVMMVDGVYLFALRRDAKHVHQLGHQLELGSVAPTADSIVRSGALEHAEHPTEVHA